MRISDDDLAELVGLACVSAKDALSKLRELEVRGHRFEPESRYPKLAEPAGAPYRAVIAADSTESVPNYGSSFGNDDRWGVKVKYGDLEGFEELLDFVRNRPALMNFLTVDNDDYDFREHVLRVNVGHLPVTAAERHIFGSGWDIDETLILREVQLLATWWVHESLPVEILAPILNIDFGVDAIDLGTASRVERMSDELQLARWPRRAGPISYGDVLPMASHALVVSGWVLSNSHALQWLRYADDEAFEVPPPLEHFIQALISCVDVPTGYVHLLYRPIGWAYQCRGPLPDVVDGPLLKRFSERLQVRVGPQIVLTSEHLAFLQKNFAALAKPDVPVAVAVARLREAELRTSELDQILDYCIGIEALVAGEPGDTTFKIATRIAAVHADAGIRNAAEIMKAARTIYGHRSDLVHGRGQSKKSRRVTVDGDEVDTLTAARIFLRNLIDARLRRPSMTPGDIDQRIICGALDMLAKSRGDVSPDPPV